MTLFKSEASQTKKKEIENLACKAIDLANVLEWEITKACNQVTAETIGSISWFLVNYEDYGFLYYIKLSELIEEKAKQILNTKKID